MALKGGNWRVIFLCIVTATTFWFFRSLNGQYTTRLNYPVSIEFDRDSLVAVEELPSSLLIDVTSGGWNLLRSTYAFNLAPITIQLENPVGTRFLAGASLFPMIADQLSDLKLNYVVTDTIFVHLEEKISRVVKIEIDTATLSLASNHRRTSPITVSTDTLLFEGPTSLIEALPDPYLISLPFENLNDSYDDDVQLLMDSSPLIRVQPEFIALKFEVEEFVPMSNRVKLLALNFPADNKLVLLDTTITVRYRWRESQMGMIPDSAFTVTSDFNNLNYSDSTIIPRVVAYPDMVQDLYLDPLQVKVVNGR